MCERTFEHFGFSHWQIGIQAVLSTMAEGLLTACVLDAGDGVSHVIPMFDGYILEHIIERLNIAGRSVTERLIKLLLLRGYAFNSTADFELVREMKEKFCFVSHNLEIDRKLCQETTCYEEEFLLPDGTIARIGRERFEAPEIMFNPLVAGSEQLGVAEMLFKSINVSPEFLFFIWGAEIRCFFEEIPLRVDSDFRRKLTVSWIPDKTPNRNGETLQEQHQQKGRNEDEYSRRSKETIQCVHWRRGSGINSREQ